MNIFVSSTSYRLIPKLYQVMKSLHFSANISPKKAYKVEDFKKSFHGWLTICFKQSKKKRVRLISREKVFRHTHTHTKIAADLNPFSKT